MTTRLFPYQHVPVGFEIVIDLSIHTEDNINGEIVPGSKGGIWNLWFNTTLSDKPEIWDDEVKAINRMQTGLGNLNDDHTLSAPIWQDSADSTPSFRKVSISYVRK